MAQTLIDKILASHLLRQEDDHLLIVYDHLLLHDATGALLIKPFKNLGKPLAHPEKILAAADHFVPPATAERAEILQQYLDFTTELTGIRRKPFQGICHQILVEDGSVGPGQFIIGADSHTIMAGALGSMACGLGSTDILFSMVTGYTWLPRPPVCKLELTGNRAPFIRGKDVALAILTEIGGTRDLADYAFECVDHTNDQLSMDSRFSLACMAAEMGASFFIIIPDAITTNFLAQKGNTTKPLLPDADATYDTTLTIAMPEQSLVSVPPAPWEVEKASDLGHIKINQAFVGSCTGGRLEDIADTAAIVRGQKVAENVRLVVIPASQNIYLQAIRAGYIEDIIMAGGIVDAPSCGPCGGIDKGIIGIGQTMIATSNRNFPGRTGPGDTYLASAPVVAASALTGVITDPRVIN
ncbi:MAG: 3-isopropylmalate dehydratase large subunit [Proteobacteria bacterium]|nr:3-isopropylmalate dehydratase large subunit [Pseudomonadota bacterium]MBU1640399.1 3-isopropylmalate dehydratase large subunit [Pseudomonadota bacterium]